MDLKQKNFSEKSQQNNLNRRNFLKFPLLYGLAAPLSTGLLAEALMPANAYGEWNASLLPHARRVESLNGVWSLTYGSCPDCAPHSTTASPPADWPTIPATVPGNVELDLVAAGRIEPLERGNRVYQSIPLETYQWWYKRSFKVDAAANSNEKVELVFDGLDCLGTIYLNGKLVGQAANMLIAHRFDVTTLLLRGQMNQLIVRIDPAVPAGLAAGRTEWERALYARWESLSIRKAPHMYGWDILPRIVSAGLWRNVRLEWTRSVRLENIHWQTQSVDAASNRAVVTVDWELAGITGNNSGYKLSIAINGSGRTLYYSAVAVHEASGHQQIALDKIDLWWPRGYGQPNLYNATLTLCDEQGEIIDQQTTRVGLRTVELKYTDIITRDHPGEFGFVVNGVPVFIKGTDWSTMDALHSRDVDHLESVFVMVTELNCNMVRCWGGNVYESDRFFDLCDEKGVLVWQDFAMACAAYPQDEVFLKAIAIEAESVVTRLRNHASLALWSGNNECDDAVNWNKKADEKLVDPNLDRITREVLPAVLKRLDPQRSYLPSSPYHSPKVFAAGNEMDQMPEVHLWGPRGYFKDPFYTKTPAHFISEIGYHGCPARSSLERMFDAEFVYPWLHDQGDKDHEWNDQWLTKSVRLSPEDKSTAGRNDLMIHQIVAFFGAVPDDLDEFILASQLTQAEAMKFFIENWRQQKGVRQGIIWWNLRDGWPIISDAVVDYYNNKKLAYTYIQRCQRDVQAICCEAVDGQHAVVIVNDTLRRAKGRVKIHRVGDGEKIFESTFDVEINGKASLGKIAHPAQTEMWSIDWETEGLAPYSSHYLATSKTIDFLQYKEWMRSANLLLS